MKAMKCARFALLGLIAFFGFPAACGSGGVVGGECLPGACADPNRNPDGGTNLDASIEAGDAGDASSGDKDGSGGGESDSGGRDSGDGAPGEGGPGDGGDDGGGMCLPPHDEPSHCGDCDTQCMPPNDLCSPDGMGGFECVPMCEPPLVECGGRCVDTNIDPLHCGRCFNECPSGICQGGMCVGANVGHVVMACMNYGVISQNAAQTRLLGNVVFLPPSNPVRILAYAEYAPAASSDRVDQVIAWAGQARGRTHEITEVTDEADVVADLNIMDYDVFLVYDQPSAPAGALAAVGAAWQSSTVLESFARAGGVVLVLSGGGGEMDELLTSADLLAVTDENDITGNQVYNRVPADIVAANVISPFLGASSTCTFETSVTPDAETLFVFTDAAAPATGEPVVVHRVFPPP